MLALRPSILASSVVPSPFASAFNSAYDLRESSLEVPNLEYFFKSTSEIMTCFVSRARAERPRALNP